MADVGGFFATLKIKSDQASFDKANKDTASLKDQIKKTGAEFGSFVQDVLKGFLAIGGAAVGAAFSVSNIQGKLALTAKSAGMGYLELTKWSNAMKLLGLDSSNLSSKMNQVQEALASRYSSDSSAYTGLAQKLAMFGVDINDFEKMNATQRISTLATKTQSEKDPTRQRSLLDQADEILGIGDMLMSFSLEGTKYRNVNELLTAAGNKPGATSGVDAVKNAQSLAGLTTTMDGLWTLFGESMMKSFRPMIDQITGFIDSHKKEITDFFLNVGTILTSVVKSLGPTIETLGKLVGSSMDAAANDMKSYEFYEKTDKYIKEHPELKKKYGRQLEKEGLGKDPSYWWITSEADNKYNKSLMGTYKVLDEITSSGDKYAAMTSPAELSAGRAKLEQSVKMLPASVTNNIHLDDQATKTALGYMESHKDASWEDVLKAILAIEGTK